MDCDCCSLGIESRRHAYASQAMFEPPPENWRRPPGPPRTTWMKNIHDDLTSLDLGIHEAGDLAQKSASLETDVFAQRYALLEVHGTIGWMGDGLVVTGTVVRLILLLSSLRAVFSS